MISNGQHDVIRDRRDERSRWHRVVLGAAVLSLFVAACDDGDDAAEQIGAEVSEIGGEVETAIGEFGEDAVGLAARNFASVQGADEFADSGHPIEGDLECTADASDDLTAVEISCGGATEDGAVAALTGTTTELPGASLTELEGTFVGVIDGTEVFNTDALG